MKKTLVWTLASTIAAVFMFVFLQQYFAFNYFYEEQFRMFCFSADYAMPLLAEPAGAVEYASSFIIQFFLHNYVGAAVAAALWLASTAALRRLCLRLYGGRDLWLAYLLPAMPLVWAEASASYHLEATVAFLLVVVVLAGYVGIRRCSLRWALAVPMVWLTFHLTGSSALLMAVAIAVIEIQLTPWRKALPFAVAIMAIAVAAPLAAFYSGFSDKPLADLLSPSLYYQMLAPDTTAVWAAWALLVAVIAIGWVVRRAPVMQAKAAIAVAAVLQIIAASTVFVYGAKHYNDAGEYAVKEFDHYANTQQWDRLLASPRLRASQNTFHACYMNLALARSGMLVNRLTTTPQNGIQGLWLQWNKQMQVSALLSDVAYTMGNVALAQNLAFEAMTGCERGINPRMLLRLVKTNIIYGAYPVAEKYIKLLQHTYAYRSSADYYAQFLFDDSKVDADSELGNLRRCLSRLDGLTNIGMAPDDLIDIMRSNTSFRPAFEYYIAFCLLSGDLATLSLMLDEFVGAPALSPMPRPCQEAVLMMHEANPEQARAYGVDDTVMEQFQQFRALARQRRSNPSAAQQLRFNFGNTYWYYYLSRQ